MPFTFSHPAAIIPLRVLPHHWFSFAGLVIGSMVPDFEFFIRMNPNANFSHTIAGIFLFCLPVGLIIASVFYNIIATPLIDNLPAFLSSRLSFLQRTDWNTYFKNNRVKVCLSILAGAVLHVVWDNFTHEHGHFAHSIPGLPNGFEIFGNRMAAYSALQHISTVVGALMIAVYVLLLPAEPNYKTTVSAKYWGIVSIVFMVIVFLKLRNGLDENWLNTLAVTCISAGLIAVTFASFISKRRALA